MSDKSIPLKIVKLAGSAQELVDQGKAPSKSTITITVYDHVHIEDAIADARKIAKGLDIEDSAITFIIDSEPYSFESVVEAVKRHTIESPSPKLVQ